MDNNFKNNNRFNKDFLNSGHFINLSIFGLSVILSVLTMILGSPIVFIVPALGLLSIIISLVKASLITLPLALIEILSPFIVVYLTYWIISFTA